MIKNIDNINKKKIALITGASRGIGLATAITLAKNDICVIGTSTTQDGAQNITNELDKFGGIGIVLDVTKYDDAVTAIKFINDNYGKINILVNNAGITRDNLLLRISENDWDAVLNTNLKSVFLLTKLIIRNMIKERYGRIVNLSSIVAHSGSIGQTNYASSKAAIIAFSKSLAKEVGSRNVTVNCVAPGFIATDMTNNLPAIIQEGYIKNIPLGRMGASQDIANAIKFLISDDANYITGITLDVNGGMY